jgi:hypothetical protein
VSHITSSGFTVKLDDNGLEGLVDLRPEEEKFSFDKWTMSLTSTTRRFQLLQTVEVEFVDAPAEGDYLALFKLWLRDVDLKPPKETKPLPKFSEAPARRRGKNPRHANESAQTETDSARIKYEERSA